VAVLPDGGDGVDDPVTAILLGGISACGSRCLTFSAGPDVIDEPAGRTTATDEKSQAGSPMMRTIFVRARHG
jgi:hypothetical protein